MNIGIVIPVHGEMVKVAQIAVTRQPKDASSTAVTE